MKSLRKKLKNQKHLTQSTPLITEVVTPDYNTVPHNLFISQESVNEDNNLNDIDMEMNERRRLLSAASSPTSPYSEQEFNLPSKKEHSWVTEARIQSAKEPVLDSEDTRFSIVGISTEDSWFSGVWQSLLILTLFLITPSIIFALVGLVVLRCCIIPNAGRSTRERKKVRYLFFFLIAGIIFSIFKDSVIVTIVLFSLFTTKVSCYAVIYPLIILLVCIMCALAPLMVYEFAGVTFSYGNEDKKDSQTKQGKCKEKLIAVEYMNKQLSSLHEVKNLKHQILLLSKQISKILILIMIIIFLVLCALRSFMGWMLYSSMPKENNLRNMSFYKNTTNTTNATMGNATILKISLPVQLDDIVMILASVNSFVMSFSLSVLFVAVFIWNLVYMQLWRRFASDLNTKNNLISSGLDGIIAWWRVYQTLIFFTISAKNPLVLLRVVLSTFFTLSSIVLSAILLSRGISHNTMNYLVVADNILLILALITSLLYSFIVSTLKKKIIQELNILKLRLANQSVSLPNEHDRNEGEYHAHLKRFKTRNVRSSLQLLQEMCHVINDSKTDSTALIIDYVYVVVVIVGLVSVGKSLS